MCKNLHVHMSCAHAQEATKDAGARNLALKEEKLQQLQTEVHQALQVIKQQGWMLQAGNVATTGECRSETLRQYVDKSTSYIGEISQTE